MKVGILTTDGGPHPADKWAEQTAAQISDIIHVEPNSLAFEELTKQKNDFEKTITSVLTSHHSIVQLHEKSALAEHGTARLNHPLVPEKQHVDDAANSVLAIAKTKIFGSHFSKPEVVSFVKDTIGSHFATSQQIERSWHADNNADTPEAQAFKAKYHPGNE